jgi:hypothetical protein
MDTEEIRKLQAAAERMAAGSTGFDRDAWQAMAEQWTILARLREGLRPPEKDGPRPVKPP